MKIIDFHAHTTNNKLWNMHVKTATIADLERLADEYGVEKIVLVATYFPFKRGGVYNKALLERTAGNDRFIVFGSLDAMNNLEEGLKELRELARTKMIRGIKLYPGYQDFDFGSELAWPIYEIAREFNLRVMIHAGELHHCCPKDGNDKRVYKCKGKCRIDELGYLAMPKKLMPAIKKFDDVNFVMSHLANPYFAELREVMTECLNVSTDISGQFISSGNDDTPEYKVMLMNEVGKFLALKNGVDRMLFATDFPVQSYADSIALINNLNLSVETEEKIFYRNAEKLLNGGA